MAAWKTDSKAGTWDMTNTLIVLFLAGVMGQQALRVWARMRGFLATTVKAIDRFTIATQSIAASLCESAPTHAPICRRCRRLRSATQSS
ncbi:hypothetical protein BOH74_22345 [Pseudomonas versuta]|uniref:Uncharacterized protein n=1 Tax=Pseudomonas versuta TaxID=1788301 RepID=A0A853ZSM7_9PSED|nr:hypothetical protein BOH74_22345 [Pseudomonas versuta]